MGTTDLVYVDTTERAQECPVLPHLRSNLQQSQSQASDSRINSQVGFTRRVRKFRVLSKENIELTIPSTDQTTSPFLKSLLEDKEEKVPTINMPDVSASNLLSFIKSLDSKVNGVSLDVVNIYNMLGMRFGSPQDELEFKYVIETTNVDEAPQVKEAEVSENSVEDDIEIHEEVIDIKDFKEGDYEDIHQVNSATIKNEVFDKVCFGSFCHSDQLNKEKDTNAYVTKTNHEKWITVKSKTNKITRKTRELSEGKVYSDNYKDGCLIKCEICSQEMSISSLNYHVKQKHGLNIAKYKEQFGKTYKFVRRTFHLCKVCGKELLLCLVSVANHVVNKHQISMKNYNQMNRMKYEDL